MDRGYTVVGVDVGGHRLAAVALDPGDRWHIFTASLDARTNTDRAAVVARLHEEFTAWLGGQISTPAYTWVEQPLLGRDVHAMRVISQVEGMVLLAAYTLGHEVYEVNVQRWKKEVIGKGNASKQHVANYIEEHCNGLAGIIHHEQDLYDAAAICLYGVGVCQRSDQLAR